MRNIDKFSVETYNQLLVEYENNLNENGPYLNIFGIFMHEIMRYLTNYIILTTTNMVPTNKFELQFTNQHYIHDLFQLDKKENPLSQKSVNYPRHLSDFLLTALNKKALVAYSEYSFGEVLKYLLHNIHKIRANKTNATVCCLPNLSKQIDQLIEYLYYFCGTYCVKNKEAFVNNFIDYLKLFVTSERLKTPEEYYIGGCNALLPNRIISANYLGNNKTVIALAHGECDIRIFDEPVFGYGEISYCSYYMTFGSYSSGYSILNKPLRGHKPIIFQRDSKIIRKISKKSPINEIDQEKSGLYIPTAFSSNRRYGPFRDLDDNDYVSYQKYIFNSGIKLKYKDHPENRHNSSLVRQVTTDSNIIHGNLTKIKYNLYGFIVLDYISTGFFISSSTTLPIIYFNYGVRNLTEYVMADIKKRVFWVDIEKKNNIGTQIKQGFNDFFSSKIIYKNTFSPKYSLNSITLNEAINSIIKANPALKT
jgi:hypothetical protein|tara:strand:- start:17350 stop:18783 length:1434 start_codon:yes stop_codon:yes gene_type:complete